MIWVAIVLFVILIATAFVATHFKNESFADYINPFNTRDMYRKPCPDIDYKKSRDTIIKKNLNEADRNNALKTLDSMCTFEESKKRLLSMSADIGDFLIMDSCVSSRKDVLISDIKRGVEDPNLDFPIREIVAEATHFSSIRTRILDTIAAEAAKVPEQRLNGPIYVLIFQVPYLVSQERNGDIVSFMNQNAAAYQMQPVNVYQGDSEAMLKYYVYLMFPGLKKLPSGQVHNIYRSEESIRCRIDFKRYKVNEELCFIRCNGENTDVYPTICGCKSEDGKSRCLGPNAQSELMDYGIIYEINENVVDINKYILTPQQLEKLKTESIETPDTKCTMMNV